jgi:hypothetical protein
VIKTNNTYYCHKYIILVLNYKVMFDLVYCSHAKDWCQEVLKACLESMRSGSSTQRAEEALYEVPRIINNKQKEKYPKKQDKHSVFSSTGKCLLNAMYL